MLIMCFIYTACMDDLQNEVLSIDEIKLDEKGVCFVKQFKENPNWKNIWKDLNQNGVLEVNKAIMNSSSGYGIHYLVPILDSDGMVGKIALFPLNITQENLKGVIPLKDPIVIDRMEVDNFKDVFDYSTSWALLASGLNVDPIFLENIQKCLSRYGEKWHNIVYKLYYTIEGERVTPWKDDLNFLTGLLNLYKSTLATCPYDHYMTIGDNCITVVFKNLPNDVTFHDLDKYVDALMLQLSFYLPEVIVVGEKPWSNFESAFTEHSENTGIYMSDPFIPIEARIYQLDPMVTPPGIPGRVYKQRNGEKWYRSDYYRPDGGEDFSNKRCVLYAIQYALKLMKKNVTIYELEMKYLQMTNEKVFNGVKLDKSFVELISSYFVLDPVFRYDYSRNILSNEPIIAFLPKDVYSSFHLEAHCVLLVGCNLNDGWLMYYNPTTGTIHESPASDFIMNEISYGLKEKSDY